MHLPYSTPTGMTIGRFLSGSSVRSPVYFSTCTNVPVHAWHPPPDDFGACNTFGHPPRSIPVSSSIWNQAPSWMQPHPAPASGSPSPDAAPFREAGHQHGITVLDVALPGINLTDETFLGKCFAQGHHIVVHRVSTTQRVRRQSSSGYSSVCVPAPARGRRSGTCRWGRW